VERFLITNGPDNEGLSVSLFHGDQNDRRPVCFVVGFVVGDEGGKEVFINMLRRESGDPFNWLFSGYLRLDDGKSLVKVNGYFNTRTKKGWIEFDS